MSRIATRREKRATARHYAIQFARIEYAQESRRSKRRVRDAYRMRRPGVPIMVNVWVGRPDTEEGRAVEAVTLRSRFQRILRERT